MLIKAKWQQEQQQQQLEGLDKAPALWGLPQQSSVVIGIIFGFTLFQGPFCNPRPRDYGKSVLGIRVKTFTLANTPNRLLNLHPQGEK